jgi:hypothetical protein
MDEVKRLTGKLDRFDPSPGKSHAYVQIGDTLHHVATSHRGVLEKDGSIRPCVNGERLQVIEPGTTISIDAVFDSKGENPFPRLWAPHVRR